MTQIQKKDTSGLVILLIAIVLAFLLVTPFFGFSCSRVFFHAFEGAHSDMPGPHAFFFNPGFALLAPLVVMFVLWTAVTLWVYRDAERRHHSGLLWGLFVLAGNIIGLIVYLIVRTTSAGVPAVQPTGANCPGCGRPVQSVYVACPYCGTSLSKKCAQCGKPAELDWKVCPYCGRAIGGNEGVS
jgi:DNA-directed RNA polymerase subunit RPC12/RpoP